MIYEKKIELSDNKYISYEILNARVIRVVTNSLVTFEHNEKNIQHVSIYNGNFYEVGSKIEVELPTITTEYYINSISKVSDKSFLINTCKESKAKHFMLPAIGYNREYYRYNTFLENVYIGSNHPKTKHIPEGIAIFCLYRFFDWPTFQVMERDLQKNPYYIDAIDVDDYHVLYVFEVPPHFRPNIEIFKLGKYSEFTKSFKEQILNFHKFPMTGETAQILFKDSRRRKQLELEFGMEFHKDLELFSKPELTEEMYE
jgi:hypothetical protein